MKQPFFIFLTFLANQGFGQNTIEYKVDSNLSVRLPDTYEIRDTLGLRIVFVTFDSGYTVVVKTPTTGKYKVEISTEKDLLEYYDGVRQGVINSTKGNLIGEAVIEKDNLKLKRFSIKATKGEDIYYVENISLLLNNNSYLIQEWVVEPTKVGLKKRNDLLSLIILPNHFNLENQLTGKVGNITGFEIGYLIGQGLGYAALIGGVIFIVVYFQRKKRLKNKTSNFFALISSMPLYSAE